jgi:hypothetical protein
LSLQEWHPEPKFSAIVDRPIELHLNQRLPFLSLISHRFQTSRTVKPCGYCSALHYTDSIRRDVFLLRVKTIVILTGKVFHFRIAPKQLADHGFPPRAVAESSGTSPQRAQKF